MKKKLIRRIIWAAVLAVLVFVVVYAWPRLPIITAFASKGMCSSVFLANKSPERVEAEDLSFFPISLAKCKINYEEKSVTSAVFGLAKRKAIFREGLGAVIVLDTPEEILKAQHFDIPEPGYDQDTLLWPLGDIIQDQSYEGINYSLLDSLLDDAVDPANDDPFRKTLGVAIVYNGDLVAERYLEGYDYTTRFHGWSMTKSIAGAMAGILVEEGKLTLDEPVNVPEWSGDRRGNMTLENIVHMCSGLDWTENYFTISEATIMLMQSDDMYEYVISQKAAYDPGTHWNYSSGDANLLSGLIRKTFDNDEAYHAFPYQRLFQRIGMLNTVIETDASGLFVASSYSYGSTRDWARFGLLILNNGVFEGDTVISPEWVNFMKQAAPHSNGQYAGTFWLKEPNPENALTDVPEDVFFADGFLGQRIYMIPSKNLVVVRMGYSLTNFHMNDFLKGILSALPG